MACRRPRGPADPAMMREGHAKKCQPPVHYGWFALANRCAIGANPQRRRAMNILFAVLFTVLSALTAGATALHIHNSLAIDKFLQAQKR
jgi:hypothetical protein